MEALALNPASLSGEEQMQLHFALGKVLADLGRHEESFGHLIAGNAIKRRQTTYDETAVLAAFDRIRAVFTPELMRAKAGQGDPSRVPVFIFGMPRSGTTLVEQIVASHPSVYGAGELTDLIDVVADLGGPGGVFADFPETVRAMSGAQLSDVGARYLDRITAMAPAVARITDKMPANFRFAGLIHLALPNARIIHTRRDPVDTCLSCFSILFGGDQPHTYDLGELGRYYRAYAALMEHWRRVLPPGVMLEVQYEEVVADLDRQARRIVEHCGLHWDDAMSRVPPDATPGADREHGPGAPADLPKFDRALAALQGQARAAVRSTRRRPGRRSGNRLKRLPFRDAFAQRTLSAAAPAPGTLSESFTLA